MKRISLHLLLGTTILALLVPACTWLGPSRLVVKPEAITRVASGPGARWLQPEVAELELNVIV